MMHWLHIRSKHGSGGHDKHDKTEGRSTRLIETWCQIGIHVIGIILKLLLTVSLFFLWILARMFKR
jgi:hypothetical protein